MAEILMFEAFGRTYPLTCPAGIAFDRNAQHYHQAHSLTPMMSPESETISALCMWCGLILPPHVLVNYHQAVVDRADHELARMPNEEVPF